MLTRRARIRLVLARRINGDWGASTEELRQQRAELLPFGFREFCSLAQVREPGHGDGRQVAGVLFGFPRSHERDIQIGGPAAAARLERAGLLRDDIVDRGKVMQCPLDVGRLLHRHDASPIE